MRTNIDIDDGLMAAAQEATGLPTKRAVVEEGLRTLVRLREQQGIRALRGRIGFFDEPLEEDGRSAAVASPDGVSAEGAPVGGGRKVRREAVVPDPQYASEESSFVIFKERMRSLERRAKGEAESTAGGGDRRRR